MQIFVYIQETEINLQLQCGDLYTFQNSYLIRPNYTVIFCFTGHATELEKTCAKLKSDQFDLFYNLAKIIIQLNRL